MHPQKIVIIGISGVGKSHLAHLLSSLLHLPIIHYDTLCWNAHWQEVPPSIVHEKIIAAIAAPVWIFEGYISPAAKERLDAADLIVYLDYSGWRALIGGIKRWVHHARIPRPELPEGCTDTLSLRYLYTMWSRAERPEIEKEIAPYTKKILRFSSPRHTKTWLTILTAQI